MKLKYPFILLTIQLTACEANHYYEGQTIPPQGKASKYVQSSVMLQNLTTEGNQEFASDIH